jgi:hypothetical protein
MRLLPLLSVSFLLATTPACERSTDLAGMSEERFVSTMVELRRIDRDLMLDSATKSTARSGTLQERNLTPAELEAAARALAREPAYALEVWARIDTLAMQQDSVPPEEPDELDPAR